jgi:thiol-disulfide isomerase/thioredoxin
LNISNFTNIWRASSLLGVVLMASLLLSACNNEPDGGDPSGDALLTGAPVNSGEPSDEVSVLEVATPTFHIGSEIGSLAPYFVEISTWINSEPLSITNPKGKVLLVDFWTYTCINCIRTSPFLQEWHEK